MGFIKRSVAAVEVVNDDIPAWVAESSEEREKEVKAAVEKDKDKEEAANIV
jgi:hypothetical protein